MLLMYRISLTSSHFSLLFVLSSFVLFLSFHRDTVRQRERVGSRGGDRGREWNRERDVVGERKRDAERERETNRERIWSTVGQCWRSRRRCPVMGRQSVAEGAIYGGQNQLSARQGRSGNSCGAGLAPIRAENARDALNGFERGISGEIVKQRERERERERQTERGSLAD